MSARCCIACTERWINSGSGKVGGTYRMHRTRQQRHGRSGIGKNLSKNSLFSMVSFALGLAVALLASEAIIRVKNSSMTNYDIEMWRYARELKVKSSDPSLDFEHLKNKTALLQSVEIRLNEWGLRGDPVPPASPDKRR